MKLPVLLIAPLAAIISVAFLLMHTGTHSGMPSVMSSGMPSGMPSASTIPSTMASAMPSSTCQSKTRSDGLYDLLVTEENQHAESLLDPNTPEGFAYNWLLNTDPAQIDPCTYPTVIQRYALVVFYNTTDGSGWNTNTGWLTGEQECSWYDVYCKNGKLIKLTPAYRSNLVGYLPSQIGLLTSMQTFSVYGNSLTGTIPDVLTKLTDLHYFSASDNLLEGPAFVNMSGLTTLETYKVDNNHLNGTISSKAFIDVIGLRNLGFFQNQITGTIPDEIGNLKNLTELYLYGNSLSGSLPEEIMLLSNLELLYLNNNMFTGRIPDSFGHFSKLNTADFSSNGFSGQLPKSIFEAPKIKRLFFDNNSFTGTIPANYANDSDVEFLLVNDNHLIGTVPSIGSDVFQYLLTFKLQNNEITGTMPDTICNLRTKGLVHLTADCAGSSPQIECAFPECCSECY